MRNLTNEQLVLTINLNKFRISLKIIKPEKSNMVSKVEFYKSNFDFIFGHIYQYKVQKDNF